MKTRFKEMLKTHSALSMEDQGKKLQETFEDWQGTLAQIDDVLVIGVRV
jgi:hypothetical protein